MQKAPEEAPELRKNLEIILGRVTLQCCVMLE